MAHPIVRALAQLATTVVVVIIAFITYCALAENSAESKAVEFCRSVNVGMPTENLLARAIEAGADRRQTQWIKPQYDDPWLPVTFTGATPLSRHICSIKGETYVREVNYTYMD